MPQSAQRVPPTIGDIYLGRQPILDASGKLSAYELLFRSSPINAARVVNDTHATSHVVTTMLGDFGILSVLGEHTGYVNVNRELLFSDAIEVLPPQRFVLEILEDVTIDEALLARCQALRALGFRIALDDIVDSGDEALVDLSQIDIVKVDFKECDRDELPRIVARIAHHGCIPLAEKIETGADYQHAVSLGFQLFQGYYFARAEILSGRRPGADRRVLLRLLGILAANPTVDVVEAELKRMPKLMVQVLRLAQNREGGENGVPFDSLRGAILKMGTRQIAHWAQMLLYASNEHDDAVRFDPLVQMIGARARFMELAMATLAPANAESADQAFIVGVVSLADRMFGATARDLVDELNMPALVRDAVVRRHGLLGELLDCAEALELGQQSTLDDFCRRHGIDADLLSRMAFEAARWIEAGATPAPTAHDAGSPDPGTPQAH